MSSLRSVGCETSEGILLGLITALLRLGLEVSIISFGIRFQ